MLIQKGAVRKPHLPALGKIGFLKNTYVTFTAKDQTVEYVQITFHLGAVKTAPTVRKIGQIPLIWYNKEN